ncbi:MAG: HDOD domain-containing protein [Myxococcales bacterium FL481]|nr:MAG: HDOD domain-containing protein [Myxococcales bacterium FL481]
MSNDPGPSDRDPDRSRSSAEERLPGRSDRWEQARREVYRTLTTLGPQDLKLPVLPTLARDALALAMQPSPSMLEVSKLVEADPVMAGRFMAAANTAMYAGDTLVNSVHVAVRRLGDTVVQELLLRLVAEAHALGDGSDARLARLRRHSLLTAHLSSKLCAELDIEAGYAFACGLFHDIGQAVMLAVLARSRPTRVGPEHDDELLAVLHPLAGERLLAGWDLPPRIIDAALHHHAYGSPNDPGGYSHIGNLVAVADRIAYCVGVGEWPADNEYFAYTALEDLQLEPERCGQLMQWAEAVAAQLDPS